MFDSLDDQMKRDEERTTTKKERMIRYAAIAVTSVLLFGGLYLGVSLLS
jgi:hypothetical protein